MNVFKSIPLKFKFLCVMSSMTLLISLMAWYNINNLAKKEAIKGTVDYFAKSVSLAEGVSLLFYERYGDIQAFTRNQIFLHYDGEKSTNLMEEIGSIFNDYGRLYGIYDLIVFTDVEGNILSTNTKDSSGKDLPKAKTIWGKNIFQSDWIKNISQGKFTDDIKKGYSGTFVEGFYKDDLASEIYGEKKLGSGFSTVVKNSQNKIVGYIKAFAEIRWIDDYFVTHIKDFDKEHIDNEVYTLLDGQNNLMFRIETNQFLEKGTYIRPDKLLEENYLAKGDYPTKMLSEGHNKGLDYFDQSMKTELVAGFTKIRTPKFIESLGWSIIVSTQKEHVLDHINHEMKNFYIITIIMQVLSVIFSQLFANNISKKLRLTADQLASETKHLLDISEQLNHSGDALSKSTTEQSSSLHETVSAIDQVNAMVTKNADNAKKSHQLSLQSGDVANKGKKSVDEMIQSIEEINRSNTEIMKQIESSNQEISGIVKVINDIGQKTKVINDIVFQTKLLSFNASVEAARAGEHGKGFAVVAEEVGNLAQMSGNAAKEISQLLEGSTQKVESIVNDTKTKVERLTQEGRSKVESGTIKAKTCGEVLDEIVHNVHNMTLMVEEISTASQEQSLGVQEINKAMIRLDQVTKENVQSASETAQSAQILKKHSGLVEECSNELFSTIEGGHKNVQNIKIKNPLPNKSDGSNIIPFKLEKNKEEKNKVHYDIPLQKMAINHTSNGHTKKHDDKTPLATDSRFEEF